jgi:hypothetical protein
MFRDKTSVFLLVIDHSFMGSNPGPRPVSILLHPWQSSVPSILQGEKSFGAFCHICSSRMDALASAELRFT